MMPTLRPARKAAEYFKAIDPDTHINESFIRKLIREGEIGVVRNGTKLLVSIEELEEYVREQLAM